MVAPKNESISPRDSFVPSILKNLIWSVHLKSIFNNAYISGSNGNYALRLPVRNTVLRLSSHGAINLRDQHLDRAEPRNFCFKGPDMGKRLLYVKLQTGAAGHIILYWSLDGRFVYSNGQEGLNGLPLWDIIWSVTPLYTLLVWYYGAVNKLCCFDRGERVKNCRFWDKIVYGWPLCIYKTAT